MKPFGILDGNAGALEGPQKNIDQLQVPEVPGRALLGVINVQFFKKSERLNTGLRYPVEGHLNGRIGFVLNLFKIAAPTPAALSPTAVVDQPAGLGIFPFFHQKRFVHPAVDMIPGKRFAGIAGASRKKIRVQALFFNRFLPQPVIELIAPAVKTTSFIIGIDKQS